MRKIIRLPSEAAISPRYRYEPMTPVRICSFSLRNPLDGIPREIDPNAENPPHEALVTIPADLNCVSGGQ